MKNKKGLEMGFAWMFAILVGMIILFLAIYGVSKFIDTSEREVNTKVALEFANKLDVLQTIASESSSNNLNLPVEARIFTSCNLDNFFGETVIIFSEKIGFGDEWSKKGGDVSTRNSYLFAENEMEGERVEFFSFPFNMPYKAGDILIAYTDNYCFINAPPIIGNPNSKLRSLLGENNEKIVFTSSISSCPEETKTVCFSGNCDIKIQCNDGNCDKGFVDKDGKKSYFTGNLLYAAIFSSKDNYECNTHRLMNRLASVSEIYSKKSQFVSSRGCINLIMNSDLVQLNASSANYDDLNDLPSIEIIAERIENKNKELECQLF